MMAHAKLTPPWKPRMVNWSLDFGCTMTIKCIWILHLVLKSRFLPTVTRPSGITSLSPKLPLWNTGNSPVFTPGSKTIWHRQSVTPTPLCEILATGLFISDSCNSTYLFKCEPLKTKRINFHCNVRHKKIFKSQKILPWLLSYLYIYQLQHWQQILTVSVYLSNNTFLCCIVYIWKKNRL